MYYGARGHSSPTHLTSRLYNFQIYFYFQYKTNNIKFSLFSLTGEILKNIFIIYFLRYHFKLLDNFLIRKCFILLVVIHSTTRNSRTKYM